jgi:hypothetical protein
MRKRYEVIFSEDNSELHTFVQGKAQRTGQSVAGYLLLLVRAVYNLETLGDTTLASLIHAGSSAPRMPAAEPAPVPEAPGADLLDRLVDDM